MSFAIDDLASVKAHWQAALTTGTPADGDPVSDFVESIAAWNMSATLTTRPLYRPTGINSLPALEFDGSNDFMISAAQSITCTLPMYAIVCNITNKNFNTLFAISTSSGAPAYQGAACRAGCLVFSAGNTVYWSGNGTVAQSPASAVGTVPNNTNALLTVKSNRESMEMRLNGLSQIANAGTGTRNSNEMSSTTVYASCGNASVSSFLQGKIAEIVFWDETSLKESDWIEGVLAAKYGLTLPTWHQFYSGAPTSGPSAGGSNLIVIED